MRNLTAEETLDLGDAIGRQATANMLAASNPPCASTFRGARRRSQLAHELLATVARKVAADAAFSDAGEAALAR